jgi:hypothetical protein
MSQLFWTATVRAGVAGVPPRSAAPRPSQAVAADVLRRGQSSGRDGGMDTRNSCSSPAQDRGRRPGGSARQNNRHLTGSFATNLGDWMQPGSLRVSWARLPPAHTVSPARTPGRSLLAITYGRRIQCPRMRRNVALGRGQLEGSGHAVSPEPRSADERPGGAARWSQAERGDDARRIVASEGTTLDGYFAGSQGEIDWQALDKSSVVRAGRLRRRDELAQPLRGSCGRNTTPTLGASPVSSRRLLSPEVI